MSFTDGKAFVVTEAQTKLRWGSGFHCKLCGVKFKAGMGVRWIYANGTPDMGTGNFFVCAGCDLGNEDTLKAGKESHDMAVRLAKQWDIYGPDWQR